jgi:hypothetical protein
LARSFRFRIPQPPAPRGRRDRACSQRELIPILGQRKLVLFRLWPALANATRYAGFAGCSVALGLKFSARSVIRGSHPRRKPPRIALRSIRATSVAAPTTAATCRRRRASRPACRGCRPGHRPPRHRRRRGKYFPAEWSSFPHRRSSRRPSRDCAPRCSR